jgi:hypothetical protein
MNIEENAYMRDLLVVTLLLLPNIVLAIKSFSGSNAGYFVICAWIVGGIIYGVYGVGLFVYGLFILVLTAFFFRARLRLDKWFSTRRTKP